MESLLSVLAGEQVAASVLGGADLGSRLASAALDDAPGLLLVSSALSVAEVDAVCEVATLHLGSAARIVVFAESPVAELAGHSARGYDYLVPPFSPDLVRRRLAGDHRGAEQIVDDARALAGYQRELRIGQEIQAGFLPTDLPAPLGWQLETRFHPARQVGGDFYDAFHLGDGRHIGFVVADVCDKGVGAALFMALIRSLLRNTASHPGSVGTAGVDVVWDASAAPRHPTGTPAGIGPLLNAVIGTDRYLVANHLRQGYFATLFFGVLDPATGSLVYVNCGHNAPVIRRSDGDQVVLPPTGPALGLAAGSSFRLGLVRLGLGDLLYVYTDGVTEAKNEQGAFFTGKRLHAVIADSGSGDARRLLAGFDGALREHVGRAEQFDDITMMALYRRPDPSSAIGFGADRNRTPEA